MSRLEHATAEGWVEAATGGGKQPTSEPPRDGDGTLICVSVCLKPADIKGFNRKALPMCWLHGKNLRVRYRGQDEVATHAYTETPPCPEVRVSPAIRRSIFCS